MEVNEDLPCESLDTTYRQLAPVIPAVKFEDDEDDIDAKPVSFTYPLSLSTSASGSGTMHKWTSSDDLNNSCGPLSLDKRPQRFYGMTGLNNLGNSCYLNSVVQCLANTRELRDYFLSKFFTALCILDSSSATEVYFERDKSLITAFD